MENKKRIVECNKCEHQFELTPELIKKEQLIKDIERQYFACPSCQETYTILITDREARTMIAERAGVNKRIAAGQGKLRQKTLQGLIGQTQNLGKRIAERTETLEQNYDNGLYTKG